MQEGACSAEATAGLSAAWKRFLEAAEQDWVDVYQVAEHRSRHVGHAERAVTRMVRQMPTRSSRSPRISAEAAWPARVANSLRAVATDQ